MVMDDKVKALLERVRGTAGYAADAAADGARAAGRRAGQMVDVAKLNVQLFDLNGEYNDILRQLGRVMVETHRGEVPESNKISRLLARADEECEDRGAAGPHLRPASGPELSRLRRALRQGGQVLPPVRRSAVRRILWITRWNNIRPAPRQSGSGWQALRPA